MPQFNDGDEYEHLPLDTLFIEGLIETRMHAELTVYPALNQIIRLFKTPKHRGDEYLVIDHSWLGDDVYQSHALDRDIVDRLCAHGIPPVIVYTTFVDGHVIRDKFNVIKGWRRSRVTQEQRITGFCFYPGMPAVVGSKFNTYRDVSVQGIEGPDISEFLDHLHANICNGNELYYTYLLKYLAHMIQKPAERPMTGIAIIGGEGTGKGITTSFLKKMMGGERNVNTTASADDTKSFNYSLAQKLLVVFDEATFSGDRKQSDFMKKLISESRIRIEQKGLDAYEVDNFTRVLITSNNMQSAVPATIGARRWLILECKNDLSQARLAEFAQRIDEPGYVNAFKHRMETLDLTDFDPTELPKQNTGFETKLHNHYKENPVFAFLCEWLNAPNLTLFKLSKDSAGETYDERLLWQDEIKFGTFYSVFKECVLACYGQVPGPNLMRSLLEKYGLKVVVATGNVRQIAMPRPEIVLATLEKLARFDQLVSDEQRVAISKHADYLERKLLEQQKYAARPTLQDYVAEEKAFQVRERKNAEEIAKGMGVAVTFIHSCTPVYGEKTDAEFDHEQQLKAGLAVSSALPESEPISNEPVDEGPPWFIDASGADWLTDLPTFKPDDDPFNF